MLNLLKNAAPLSKEQHSETYLETGMGYDFTKGMAFVPTLVTEIPNLISDYALAFVEKGGNVALVALLGLKEGENLYLNADGTWAADYVPAVLRQYPFAAMMGGEGQERRGVLCIAEDFPGINTEGKGVALFGEDGEASDLVTSAQKMVTEFASGALRTKAFNAELQKHELLKPMRAILKNTSGEERRISGLLAVDRTALKELPAEDLKALQDSGALELIYLQLASMKNLRELASRIGETPNATLN
ncbi:SapC family protein [Actibacterium pelagium]|uniref:SapC protein n=1 Tax=Actibacterium pelagium TaxID=2029103 RepID=A0A917EL70_9RHOB|nr:SapC family protein [Actibacterium pelagium]GGE52062.1 hypothetical protein GCM10011517_19740 [Actibacterium pelagium]